MAPFTRHRLWQLATDAALIVAAWYLAFRLRFDHEIPIYYRTLFDRTVRVSVDAYDYKYSDFQIDYFDATKIQYITKNAGSVWDITFSRDPDQKYIFLADGN